MISEASNKAGTRLRGVAVCSGIYLGTARVLLNDEDAQAVRPGEIIVSPSLLAGLEALMPYAGAIIAEADAAFSNGAMLAREFRVPAIAAVANATSHINSGDELLVDG